eukprot:TRINITY_DN4500_c0_g1_i1.p1 TRINITY_DN4500_c0_g1~~TRINITY_DN4500_c0_g1_i1.p1  ORF type:complete len:370 (-),score=90.58 TRINITY_DN4500_c0_g1_i1:448-1557(-)
MSKLKAETLSFGHAGGLQCQFLDEHRSCKRLVQEDVTLPLAHRRIEQLTRRRGIHASFLYQPYIPEGELGGDLAPPPGKRHTPLVHAAKGPPKVLHSSGPEGPIVKESSKPTRPHQEVKADPAGEDEAGEDDFSQDAALEKEVAEMKADIKASQDDPGIGLKPAADEGNRRQVPLWPPAGGTLPPVRPPVEDDDGWKPVKEAEPFAGPSAPGGIVGAEMQLAEEGASDATSAAANQWFRLGTETKFMLGIGAFGAGLFLTLSRGVKAQMAADSTPATGRQRPAGTQQQAGSRRGSGRQPESQRQSQRLSAPGEQSQRQSQRQSVAGQQSQPQIGQAGRGSSQAAGSESAIARQAAAGRQQEAGSSQPAS